MTCRYSTEVLSTQVTLAINPDTARACLIHCRDNTTCEYFIAYFADITDDIRR